MSGIAASQSLKVHREKIKSIIDAQKLLKMKEHGKWCIKMYWGQLPLLDEVMQLGFSGYAITDDVENSSEADLSENDGTQIVIGPKAVIIWTASSEEQLGAKIESAFNNFKWNEEKK